MVVIECMQVAINNSLEEEFNNITNEMRGKGLFMASCVALNVMQDFENMLLMFKGAGKKFSNELCLEYCNGQYQHTSSIKLLLEYVSKVEKLICKKYSELKELKEVTIRLMDGQGINLMLDNDRLFFLGESLVYNTFLAIKTKDREVRFLANKIATINVEN